MALLVDSSDQQLDRHTPAQESSASNQADDVVRLKEIQAQLIERVRKFITGFPFGLIIVRPDQTIKAINKIALEYFSFQERELARQHVSVLFPGVTGFDRDAPATRLIAQKKTGEAFIVETSVNILEQDGEELYFVSVQDVNEKHRLETLRRDLITMVTHDLRAPLTTLRVTLEMLEQGLYGDLSSRGKDLIEHGLSSIGYLNSLVENLLDAERLEQGSIKLTCTETTTGKLINRALHSVQLPESIIELDVNNDMVVVDEDRIVQVLINLISNALKHAEGTTITVRATIEGTMAKFEVEDGGKGIPEQQKQTIFDRFKQIERADQPRKQGFGLGLFICKSLVDLHGGRIWVEDRHKKTMSADAPESPECAGSRFCFTVPQSPQEC